MNKKHITIAIIAIFLFSITAMDASAQLFDTLFDNMNDFFAGGWRRYDALLSFFLIFIMLFSAAYAGLKKAFGDDKTKSRPAMGIALAFAGIGAAGIVSGFGFTLERYGFLAIGFLILILVFIVYSLLLKLGLEKHKLMAFLIAVLIVGIIVFVSYSLMEAGGVRFGTLGFSGGRGVSSPGNIFTRIGSIFKKTPSIGGGGSIPEEDVLAGVMGRAAHLDTLYQLETDKQELESELRVLTAGTEDYKNKQKEIEAKGKEIEQQRVHEKEYLKYLSDYCLKEGAGLSIFGTIKSEASKITSDNQLASYNAMSAACTNAYEHRSKIEGLEDDEEFRLLSNYKNAQGGYQYEKGKYAEGQKQYESAQEAYLKVLDSEFETGYETDAVAKLEQMIKAKEDQDFSKADGYYDLGKKLIARGQVRKDEKYIEQGNNYLNEAKKLGQEAYKGGDTSQRINYANFMIKLYQEKSRVGLTSDEQKELEEYRKFVGDTKEEEKVTEEKKTPMGVLIAIGVVFLLGLIYMGGVMREKKVKKKEEEKPFEEKLTIEERLKKLENAIASTIEQKDNALRSIEKVKENEIKDADKFIKSIKEFSRLFEKKLLKDPAWLADVSRESEINKDLKEEQLKVKKLLHDEVELEKALLELMKQEKILEGVYTELLAMEGLDTELKTGLGTKRQELIEIVKLIEDVIKDYRLHLKDEELTEENLIKLLDPKKTKPEERIKPIWMRYKEANESKIKEYVNEDEAHFNKLKENIKKEKNVLTQVKDVLSKKEEKVEEEEKEKINKLLEEAENIEKEPNNYGDALEKLKGALELNPSNGDIQKKIAELEDKIKRRKEFKGRKEAELSKEIKDLKDEIKSKL